MGGAKGKDQWDKSHLHATARHAGSSFFLTLKTRLLLEGVPPEEDYGYFPPVSPHLAVPWDTPDSEGVGRSGNPSGLAPEFWFLLL